MDMRDEAEDAEVTNEIDHAYRHSSHSPRRGRRGFSGYQLMESSCTTGKPADQGSNCLFICDKSTEKTQAPPLTDAPLPLSQAVSGKPA
jgi:hypothetical protein